MKNNPILKLFFMIGACTLAANAEEKTYANTNTHPNIVFILADDLGYGHFGPNMKEYSLEDLNFDFLKRDREVWNTIYDPKVALAAARKSTQNLSKLADEGIRFREAHVALPLCAPSRAAIMTARYPQRYGGYCNMDIAADIGLPAGETVLAKLLKKQGYTNGIIGKWHLQALQDSGRDMSWQHPLNNGFDYYFGFNDSTSLYVHPEHIYRNFTKVPAEEVPYTTDVFTEEALDFIERNSKKPFFLYLAYNAAHGPYDEVHPKKYVSHFNTGNPRLDVYNAIVFAMDDGIGRILDKLEELNLREKTLVIFLSDNGPSGSRWSVLPAAGPFRGLKGNIWQGGLRVPMLMSWPGKLPAGMEYDQLVSSMDVMPTVLAVAGCDIPSSLQLDGHNLLPALLGQKNSAGGHKELFFAGQNSEFWGLKGRLSIDNENFPDRRGNDSVGWAVRRGDYLLRYWGDSDSYELFNVKKDKGERVNILSPEYQQLIDSMKNDYAQWFRGMKPPNKMNFDRWRQLIPKSEKDQ